MKKIISLFAFVILLSCEPTTTTPNDCTSTTGTQLCFNGRIYEFTDVFWEKVGNHVEIQLEPNPTGPGEYASIYAFLYGTTIQSDTVPHLGTYTSIPFGTPSTGSLDFSGYLMTMSGATITNYTYEQDATNTLTITSFTSNQVSGNGTMKFRNTITNEVKNAIFSFENIPFQ